MRCNQVGRRAAAVCVIGAALLAGCSSSKPAVCTDADNLKASVQDLKNTNIRSAGVSAVNDDLTKIRQQLQTLKNDAKGQYTTQINDLTNALNSLQTSVSAAKANVNAGTLSALASAAGSAVTAGQNLVNAVEDTC